MGTADELLGHIYAWIEQREHFADELMSLAKELEVIRERCSREQSFRNACTAVGASGLIGSSHARGSPFLGMAGAQWFSTTAYSLSSSIVEQFFSSGPMKIVKATETNSNEMRNKFMELVQRLKAEVRPDADADEVDRHALNEMIAAMAKQRGLSGTTILSFLDDQPRFKFELKRGIKALLGGTGGSVLLGFSLQLAIDNWRKMIRRDQMTEANQSLRQAAASEREKSNALKSELDRIQKVLTEVVKSQSQLERDRLREALMKCQRGMTMKRRTRKTERLEREPQVRARQRERPEIINTKMAIVVVLAVLGYLCSGWKKSEEDQSKCTSCALRMALLRVEPNSIQLSQISQLISESKLDVFLTTQTGLEQSNGHQLLHQTSPERFSFYSQAKDSRGGGLAIQFSELLQDDFFVFDFITTFQYLATELRHPQWKNPVFVLLIDQPTSSSSAQFTLFLTELQTLLDQVTECYDSIVLTGDFNLPPDDDASSAAAQFEDLLRINELVRQNNTLGQHLDVFENLILSKNVDISALSTPDNRDLSHYTTFNVQIQNLLPKVCS